LVLCADGGPARLGNKPGFSALMKQDIPHLQGTLTVAFIAGFCIKILASEIEESS